MSETMNRKLAKQISAPERRRAREEQEAKESLDKFMAEMEKELGEKPSGGWAILTALTIGAVFLGAYLLGIHLSISG